ncbi:MAG: Asp-tRNA(Asn)/Glu-tRNA(Gln) amidotransferase GatCAB subunit C [Thaumarchaeota archaeon]|nr:Asp-tRNA(Asn)/Glu-tRNA(Gln) amidotransferase GatCAB subunit C [Nitrososphaerota archaeon]|tara:strand:- start:3204 stop:3479 length:276 start_codon:yes stop_codon:yes gene_type:complete
MMVSKEEVKHLAWLARIELDDKELEVYTKQVEQIISYFDTLDKISLEDIHISQRSVPYSKFRDDVPKESTDNVLSVVKNSKEKFVKAPKMA